MSGVYVPPRRDTSTLTTILKGLSIAKDLYGMKVDSDKLEMMQQEHEARMAADAEAKGLRDDLAAGRLSKGEQLALRQKGYVDAKKGDAGAFGYVDKESGQEVFIKPPSAAEKPMILPAGASLVQGGKIVTTAPRARGDGAGGAPLVQVETVDKDGNPIITFVRKQEGASYPAKSAAPKTPQALSGTDRQRYDSAIMGLDAVKTMRRAYDAGSNTFSVIGDNDYTAARSRFEEALGRMQSGGAISNDEEKRFSAMAPTWRDSAEIQQKKLDWLETEMASRIKSMGFDPDKLADERAAFAESRATPQRPSEGTAIAAPNTSGRASKEDAAALGWLLKNPNHPQAGAVRETLRAKGLVQ